MSATQKSPEQINIILPADAGADWSKSIGYAKGEDVVAHDGVANTLATVIAKLNAKYGQLTVLDHISARHGRLVARISRMWSGGGDEFVYSTSPEEEQTPVSAELIAERVQLTTQVFNCEPGAFPGTAANRAESTAIKALAEFDAAHPEVAAAIASQSVPSLANHIEATLCDWVTHFDV